MPTARILSRPNEAPIDHRFRLEIQRFAAQNELLFLDLNQIDFQLESSQFRDWSHLNYEGAEIISDYLARVVIAPSLGAEREHPVVTPTS